MLKIPKSSVQNYLNQFSYENHFDIWVLYKLGKKKKSLIDCISVLRTNCVGDEKWILYDKVEWERSWYK